MTVPACTISDLQITMPGGLELVCGASLDIHPGQITALVGESGCGKSMTALAMLRLLPHKAQATGTIQLGSDDLLRLPEHELRTRRGNRIAIVFQEPMTALNPVLTIGDQVAEPLRIHQSMSKQAAAARAVEMLARVGLPDPARTAKQYPHQLSGGMRQRVVIAMALICRPDVLIADEPTTALDASTQLQILDLLAELQQEIGMGVLLITHDLSLVRQRADHLAIMYAGRIVEAGPVRDVLAQPAHPYTAALLSVAPRLDRPHGGRLPVIAGDVPQPSNRPSGCAFHPRCDTGRDDPQCQTEVPDQTRNQMRSFRCWHPQHQAPA